MKDYSDMFMDIAIRTSSESNCVKYKVGAVIVKDNRIILQGYNGTIPGFQNCSKKFEGLNMNHPNYREEHSKWSQAFEVHAEMNIISYAAKKGVSLESTTMFCTHAPCNNCLKHLIQSGIIKVVYDNEYHRKSDFNDREELLKFIELEKYQIK